MHTITRIAVTGGGVTGTRNVVARVGAPGAAPHRTVDGGARGALMAPNDPRSPRTVGTTRSDPSGDGDSRTTPGAVALGAATTTGWSHRGSPWPRMAPRRHPARSG